MGKFIFNRALQAVPVVMGVLTISFMLMVVLPGDPVLSMIGERYDENTVELMRKKLNLDKPLIERMGIFMGDVLRGDLGHSIITGRSVTKEILDKFPNTLILAVAAMTVAVLIGISLGMVASLVPGSWIDKTIMVLALTGVSAPVFWTGLIFILMFGVYLGWLPSLCGSNYTTYPVCDDGHFKSGLYSHCTIKRAALVENIIETCPSKLVDSCIDSYRNRFWKLFVRGCAHRIHIWLARSREADPGGYFEARPPHYSGNSFIYGVDVYLCKPYCRYFIWNY